MQTLVTNLFVVAAADRKIERSNPKRAMGVFAEHTSKP
jgi:hypothetical protein